MEQMGIESKRGASYIILNELIIGEDGWHLLRWEDQYKEEVLRFVESSAEILIRCLSRCQRFHWIRNSQEHF